MSYKRPALPAVGTVECSARRNEGYPMERPEAVTKMYNYVD